MPELAEVYFHASKWKAATGECFALERANTATRCGRDFDAKLGRKLFRSIELKAGYTHGKRMLFEFADAVFLELHLGMTGSLHVCGPDSDLQKHDHLALRGERTLLVFRDPRRFGCFRLHRGEQVWEWWNRLPPEPSSEGFNRRLFDGYCQRFAGSVLKAFLLKQECFPGVGNWMADEILWRAHLLPQRRARELDATERADLFRSCRFVCRRALQTIGADYRDPPRSWLFQHRWRDGGVCPRTGEPLSREQVGGRTTCWSPAWQK